MTPEQMQALRPGDLVAYEAERFDHRRRAMTRRWVVTKVERRTSTQIVTFGLRWATKTGLEIREMASSGRRRCLQEATAERIQAAKDEDEREARVRRFGGGDYWEIRDLATLRAVKAILDGGGS